jgi:hypothetical protein
MNGESRIKMRTPFRLLKIEGGIRSSRAREYIPSRKSTPERINVAITLPRDEASFENQSKG